MPLPSLEARATRETKKKAVAHGMHENCLASVEASKRNAEPRTVCSSNLHNTGTRNRSRDGLKLQRKVALHTLSPYGHLVHRGQELIVHTDLSFCWLQVAVAAAVMLRGILVWVCGVAVAR